MNTGQLGAAALISLLVGAILAVWLIIRAIDEGRDDR